MAKIEQVPNPNAPVPSRNKFKCHVRYSSDRSKAMADILQYDEDAEFNICGDWSFKVKTTLSLNDMNRIMIYRDRMTNVKKTWFF